MKRSTLIRTFSLFVLALVIGCPPQPTSKKEVPQKTSRRARVPSGPTPFNFTTATPKPVVPEQHEVPMSLTASDGTGLEMVALVARGVIEEPLAFTELHLTFQNPQPRTIEGHFRITLPVGASISRFAMKIGNHWQEGEVVERQAARRAYEDFLHRRQDPALLEQGAANAFSARVFPIPANGKKELILSYSQELEQSSVPYRIPLVGLPQLGTLDIRVAVAKTEKGSTSNLASGARSERSEQRRVGSGFGGPGTRSIGGATVSHQVVEVKKAKWVPDKDFEVAQVHAEGRLGLRHENLVVARVTPIVDSEPASVSSLLVMVDTSASRALGFPKQLNLLKKLMEGLARGAGPQTKVAVACFDQAVELSFEGTAAGFDTEAIKRIRKHKAMGASDLTGALRWIEQKDQYRRVLFITDGVATAGENEREQVIAAAKALKVDRIDAVAVGGIRDEDLLHEIVTALNIDGAVIDGDLAIPEIGRKLSETTRSGIVVVVPGAKWVWPKQLDGFQAGDEVLVYADLPKNKPFSLTLGGVQISTKNRVLAGVERPLLERAWVEARISKLTHQRDVELAGDKDMRSAIKKQITEISIRHRVLSPYTALLVLETEADYARYSIDRNALADILTVEGNRLTVLNRTAKSIAPAVMTKKDKKSKPKKKNGGGGSDNGDDDEFEAPPVPGDAPAPPPPPSADSAKMGAAESDMDMDGALEGIGGLSAAGSSGGSVNTGGAPSRPAAEPRRSLRRRSRRGAGIVREHPKIPKSDPYTGKFKEIMLLLRATQATKALTRAMGWREEAPGDVMALVAVGEAFEAQKDLKQAARAYGSLIDLFPSRADMRRFAGERLERIADQGAILLAVDTYKKATEQRPDHPASHRLYAMALIKAGKPEAAFDALVPGAQRNYPSGRFAGVHRILKEDLGLVAAAWIKKEPAKRAEILKRLEQAGGIVENKPSLRFVLNWETDANDVDFHIYDGKGGHAYYSQKQLSSGGELYADVTTGYGPECFTIRLPKKRRSPPYVLQAHYYSRGPMGYGMGMLQIIEHDGKGGLTFEDRPFVVMTDGAYLDLGSVPKGAQRNLQLHGGDDE